MRINPEKLATLTGVVRPASQAKWFRTHFGVTLPVDALGPIITESAFNSLVEQRCGLLKGRTEIVADRPAVKLTKKVTEGA